MNRLIIIIFYVSLWNTVIAQPSVFVNPSKYWKYNYYYYADFRSSGIPDTGADIEVFNVGELERNGTTYQLAYLVKGHLYHISSMVDTLLYRWEGKRAYADFKDMCRVFYNGDEDALRNDYPCVGCEVVLYDFALDVGDSFGCTSIRDVSTVTVGNEPRKLITLAKGHRLLEGIGSLNGGFFEYMKTPLWLTGFDGICASSLSCYEEDQQLVYQQSSEEAYEYLLNEEDVREYLLMEIRDRYATQMEGKNSVIIHDLQGRRLNGAPHKGIYIRNGRKYVVR